VATKRHNAIILSFYSIWVWSMISHPNRRTQLRNADKILVDKLSTHGWTIFDFFFVLLTMHLSILILEINQLDDKILFYNKLISCLYMFQAPCAHYQEVKIVLYSIWYHHTYRSQPVHGTATYWCDDTRACIIQFWPPDDEHMVLKTCRGMK